MNQGNSVKLFWVRTAYANSIKHSKSQQLFQVEVKNIIINIYYYLICIFAMFLFIFFLISFKSERRLYVYIHTNIYIEREKEREEWIILRNTI